MKSPASFVFLLALVFVGEVALGESRLFDEQGTRLVSVLDNDRSSVVSGNWAKAVGTVNSDQLESDGRAASRKWVFEGLNPDSRYRVSVSWRTVLTYPQNPKNVEYRIYAATLDGAGGLIMKSKADQSRQPSNYMTREPGPGYLYTAAWETIGEVRTGTSFFPSVLTPPLVNLEVYVVVPEGSVGAVDAVRLDEITDGFRVADNSTAPGLIAPFGFTDYFVPAGSNEYFMYTANGTSVHHQPNIAKAGDWYFVKLPAGKYRVAATWPYSTTASQSISYSVTTNGVQINTAPFNQRYTPVDFSRRGASWNYLRDSKGKPVVVEVSFNGTVKVSLSGSDRNTLADAVALVAPEEEAVFDDFESYTMSDIQYDNVWNFVDYGLRPAPYQGQTYFRSGTLAALNQALNLRAKKSFNADVDASVEFSIGPVNQATLINLYGRGHLQGKGDSETFINAYIACGYTANNCYLAILHTGPRVFQVLARKDLTYDELNSVYTQRSDRLTLSMKGNSISLKLNDQHEIIAADNYSPLDVSFPIFSLGLGVNGAAGTVLKQFSIKE